MAIKGRPQQQMEGQRRVLSRWDALKPCRQIPIEGCKQRHSGKEGGKREGSKSGKEGGRVRNGNKGKGVMVHGAVT